MGGDWGEVMGETGDGFHRGGYVWWVSFIFSLASVLSDDLWIRLLGGRSL